MFLVMYGKSHGNQRQCEVQDMKRTSFKEVNEKCEALGWKLIKHENLGNRKSTFYTYSIVNEAGEFLSKDLTLRDVFSVACYNDTNRK